MTTTRELGEDGARRLRELERMSVKASTRKGRWGYDTTAPEPGLDSLLYFDALQRLGKLPSKKAMGDDE